MRLVNSIGWAATRYGQTSREQDRNFRVDGSLSFDIAFASSLRPNAEFPLLGILLPKSLLLLQAISHMSYSLPTIFSQDTLHFWQIVVGKNGQLMAWVVEGGDRTLHISFDQSLNRHSSREVSLSYSVPVLTADHFISTIRSLLNRAAALSLCLLKRLIIHP